MKITVTPQTIKAHPGLVKAFAGRRVRIWSGQWRMFWRADGRGYTPDVKDAGIYTFEEALRISKHAGPEKEIEYQEVE